jgi:hypothetical protein
MAEVVQGLIRDAISIEQFLAQCDMLEAQDLRRIRQAAAIYRSADFSRIARITHLAFYRR